MPSFAPEQGNPHGRRGKLLVISGPSGVGKGTLIEAVLPRLEDTELAVSATTRPRREHEQHGREYFFLSDEDFDDRVEQGDFLEHVRYGSSRYGTLASKVEAALRQGRNVILEIELEGARAIRERVPGAVLFFIEPPDISDLRKRLEGRDTETSADIEIRLKRAAEELASKKEFDYIVVNDSVARAADELERSIRDSLEGGES